MQYNNIININTFVIVKLARNKYHNIERGYYARDKLSDRTPAHSNGMKKYNLIGKVNGCSSMINTVLLSYVALNMTLQINTRDIYNGLYISCTKHVRDVWK